MTSINIKQALILGLTGVFFASQTQAISLGQLDLDSTMLQPLKLQVELVEIGDVLPESIAAKVAGPAQFLAAGLAYQPWYGQLNAKVINHDDQYFVTLEGQQPVQQKQLDLMIELDYLGGRLLAEYAIDLPAFVPSTTVENIPKAEITPASVIVKPGQTLWRVAVNNRSKGISTWQTLMALYHINPTAFKNGDIRYVLANSRLRLPTQTELTSLTAKQAEAAFNAVMGSPVKQVPPLAKQVTQQLELQADVVKQQEKLTGLASQSEALQAQVESLKVDKKEAIKQHQLLVQTSKDLAQGVAVQQQDIKNLSSEKVLLQTNVQTLDQKFAATQANLNRAEQDLTRVQHALVVAQERVGLAQQLKARTDKEGQLAQWLNMAQMLALLLVPVVLIAGLVWWVVRRGRAVVAYQVPVQETTNEQPVALDPLDAYDQQAASTDEKVYQGTQKMHTEGMSERGFIEQLLQEQPIDKTQSQDQGYLSVDVEATLSGERQTHGMADEPVEYLSHAEDMNTKLDLALSYQAMGDIPKAQAILQEVVNHGSPEQLAQATALLSRMNTD
ncbi:MAG: hypothetical protein PSN46_05090 [Gammaproteobacteria bacterium]|nr:hypothetical protein [Gammaproteobacteria bacterium]